MCPASCSYEERVGDICWRSSRAPWNLVHVQCGRIVGSWAQARAAAHPQSAHDHPVTKRSKYARLRQMVGHDEHQRARFKERWASSACVASTAPIVIPNSLRCVHPTHRRSSMGNPGAPPPALLRGRSTSTVRTRAQHPGPFGRAGHDQMLARSWRALKAGICSRLTGRHRGTPRELSARMRSASPQPGRSSGSTPARLRLAKTRYANCSAAFFGVR